MKDQEQKQKNPKNKKLLTYYLILGACILVIAAVVVAVTLSVTLGGNDNLTIENPDDDITDVPDDGGDDDGDADDTSGDMTFMIPVDEVDAVNTYGFYHNTTLNKYYLHTGIDFAADAGTDVFAALDGTVESILTDSRLTGTTITLSHENGLKTTYTYVDAVETLNVGDTVAKGDVIATVAEAVGNEYKDGAHLHFEVFLNNEAVDPETYLDIDGK